MRALHPIAPQETLVCWGTYQYLKGSRSTGQIEGWSIHRLPDGTEIVRADVDGRKAPQAPDILTHLTRNSEGQLQELSLHYRTGEFQAKVTCDFEAGHVALTRELMDHPTRRDTVEVASGYAVDYHPIISCDYVWRGYPAYLQDELYAVPVFSLDIDAGGGDLLRGCALRVSIRPLEPESLTIPAGTFENAQRYQVMLPNDTEATVWFDQRGIPLRWFNPTEDRNFVLIRYRFQEVAVEE